MQKHFGSRQVKGGFTRTNFWSKNSRGFTLIELLVVIAIIGILSSVVLASLNSARTKARDARRVADLKQIQVALELYYDANGSYPLSIAALVGSTGGQSLPFEPKDPGASNPSYKYSYDPATNPSKYHLGATMEQGKDATTLDDADADADSSAWAGGTKFVGGPDSADPWIYDVRN